MTNSHVQHGLGQAWIAGFVAYVVLSLALVVRPSRKLSSVDLCVQL